MELTIIGSSPADPNPGGASSGYVLDCGEGQLLLECGHGVAGKVQLYTSLDRIVAALISHMHPDHFFDLVGLKYALERHGLPKLPLYLPPGGEDILAGIADALGNGQDLWTASFDLHTFDPKHGLDLAGFHISMAHTHHFIDAWAMAFEPMRARDRKFAFTSDTSHTQAVAKLARGANLLMAEAAVAQQTKPTPQQGHMTPTEAGTLAREAGVERLVLTHYPAADADRIKRDAAEAFGREVELASEGRTFVV